MKQHKKPPHHLQPYKTAAQTAGLVACIFILIFFAGKGVPGILKNEENQWIPFIPFLLLSVAGYIVSWYKELIGTIVMTTGGIILLSFFIIKGDALAVLVYGLPFIIAGCAFIIHINKRNQLKRKAHKTIS